MSINGITNVLIILKNDTYTSQEYNPIENIEIFKNRNELEGYHWPARLQAYLDAGYFEQGSRLVAYVVDWHIAGFTWMHDNFDPNGDVSLLDVKEFHIAGPLFVEQSQRGKGVSGKLKNQVSAYAKENTGLPIYAVNSFDNIPIIRNNMREDYQLSNVIIKLKRRKPIIL